MIEITILCMEWFFIGWITAGIIIGIRNLFKTDKKLELTEQQLERLWEWEQFIPHDKYRKIDRKLLLKIRNLFDKTIH